jgi:hypothetical protein
MSNDPKELSQNLDFFRAAVYRSELRGKATVWVVERAGMIVAELEAAGMSQGVVENARQLVNRALRLPLELN